LPLSATSPNVVLFNCNDTKNLSASLEEYFDDVLDLIAHHSPIKKVEGLRHQPV